VSDKPSRQTLDEIPSRILAFVLGVARYPAARASLGQKGYTQADHDNALALLAKLGAYPAAPPAAASDKAVQAAVVELDAWDNDNFPIIRKALEHKHPAYVDTLFADLEPKEGNESVGAVKLLLDRLDDLEKDTSPEAQAAMATIGARGYTPAERQRLRALVIKASAFVPAVPVSNAERDQILLDLYAWLGDWGTTAKAAIKSRAILIAMGLASRRKPAKKAATPAAPAAGAGTGAAGGSGGAAGGSGGAAGGGT